LTGTGTGTAKNTRGLPVQNTSQQILAGRTLRVYRPITFKMYGLTRSVAMTKTNVFFFFKKTELMWEKDLQKF
jgi:hypothetical protein